MGEQALLTEMVQRLAAAGHPRRIILFGSQARGDARADSDYDFLIIEDSGEPRHRRSVPYYRALSEWLVPQDVVVMTPAEIEDCRELPQSLAMTALREGRVVYEDRR